MSLRQKPTQAVDVSDATDRLGHVLLAGLAHHGEADVDAKAKQLARKVDQMRLGKPKGIVKPSTTPRTYISDNAAMDALNFVETKALVDDAVAFTDSFLPIADGDEAVVLLMAVGYTRLLERAGQFDTATANAFYEAAKMYDAHLWQRQALQTDIGGVADGAPPRQYDLWDDDDLLSAEQAAQKFIDNVSFFSWDTVSNDIYNVWVPLTSFALAALDVLPTAMTPPIVESLQAVVRNRSFSNMASDIFGTARRVALARMAERQPGFHLRVLANALTFDAIGQPSVLDGQGKFDMLFGALWGAGKWVGGPLTKTAIAFASFAVNIAAKSADYQNGYLTRWIKAQAYGNEMRNRNETRRIDGEWGAELKTDLHWHYAWNERRAEAQRFPMMDMQEVGILIYRGNESLTDGVTAALQRIDTRPGRGAGLLPALFYAQHLAWKNDIIGAVDSMNAGIRNLSAASVKLDKMVNELPRERGVSFKRRDWERDPKVEPKLGGFAGWYGVGLFV